MGHGVAYEDALAMLYHQASAQRDRIRTATTTVSLLDAVGRISSCDIMSPMPMPMFDNTAMDGFIVNSEATFSASVDHPAEFEIMGTIAAGDDILQEADKGTYQIFTGAAIPHGTYFDAVLRVEDALVQDGKLLVKTPLRRGLHIRRRAEDVNMGDCMVPAGRLITTKEIVILASLGFSSIAVYNLRIGIISTGSELVYTSSNQLGHETTEAKIYNSNAAYLSTSLAKYGICQSYGIVHDNETDLLDVIRKAAKNCDLLVSTGGVSAGGLDLVPDAVTGLGNIVFHHVAMRPGHPVLFGIVRDNVPYFGLPGTPTASAATSRFLVQPYLDHLLQSHIQPPLLLKASSIPSRQGLTFYRASRHGDEVEILQGQHGLKSLLSANCWAKVDAREGQPANGFVEVVDE